MILGCAFVVSVPPNNVAVNNPFVLLNVRLLFALYAPPSLNTTWVFDPGTGASAALVQVNVPEPLVIKK